MKIKKNDQVVVTTGKYKGAKGRVGAVDMSAQKVLIPGVNIIKKHKKLNKENQKDPGGIVEMANPISISNVKLICPSCNEPTRVGYEISDKGIKSRVCKKCNKII